MSRKLTNPIALSALLAVLAAPLMAQDAAPAPTTPAAPSAEAQAQTVTLPQILKDAGLTDVTSKQMRHGGTRILGTLPDGQKIGAMLAEDGTLRGIRAMDEATVLPQALVDQLVPQAVRDNAVFGQLGKLGAVFNGERGVMVAGTDAQGNDVRAAFAQDGTLVRFGRGDDMNFGKDEGQHFGKGEGKDRDGKHRHFGRKGDRDGDREDGHRHWGRHGGKHDGDREGGRDDRRGPPPGDMPPPPPAPPAAEEQGALPMPPAGGDMREAAAPVVDQGEVRMTLTEAGYSGIGEITQRGPRILAMAVNPEGEPVAVELDGQGEVLREINR